MNKYDALEMTLDLESSVADIIIEDAHEWRGRLLMFCLPDESVIFATTFDGGGPLPFDLYVDEQTGSFRRRGSSAHKSAIRVHASTAWPYDLMRRIS